MRGFIRQYMDDVTLANLPVYIVFGALVALILITIPAKLTLLMLPGIFVIAVIVRRPEIGILIIVVLTSSIVFEESLPLIPIGIGSLQVADVLLLFMLGTLVYRYIAVTNFSFTVSPLDIPLVLFFSASLVSAAVSVVHYGTDFNDVVRLVRIISYYLIFFLITNFVTEKGQLRFLIIGLFGIAAVVSVAMVAQAIVGDSIQLMPGRIENAASLDREFGTLRILPPGQTLVFVTFLTAICAVVFVRGKPVLFSGNFWLVLLLGVGIVLTYNRSYWVAVILGVMLLLMMTAPENRRRLAALIAVVLLFGGSAIVMFSGTEGKLGATITAVSDRFGSLFAGKELTGSSSLDFRRIENEYALAQVKNHPMLGIGLGNNYRPEIYGADDKLNYYVHNAFLWLMTDMGITGFLLFAWLYLRFLFRAAWNWRNIDDDFLKSAVVGFLISGIAILPMAMVIPIFLEWFSVVIIGVMLGLTESIINYSKLEADNRVASS